MAKSDAAHQMAVAPIQKAVDRLQAAKSMCGRSKPREPARSRLREESRDDPRPYGCISSRNEHEKTGTTYRTTQESRKTPRLSPVSWHHHESLLLHNSQMLGGPVVGSSLPRRISPGALFCLNFSLSLLVEFAASGRRPQIRGSAAVLGVSVFCTSLRSRLRSTFCAGLGKRLPTLPFI